MVKNQSELPSLSVSRSKLNSQNRVSVNFALTCFFLGGLLGESLLSGYYLFGGAIGSVIGILIRSRQFTAGPDPLSNLTNRLDQQLKSGSDVQNTIKSLLKLGPPSVPAVLRAACCQNDFTTRICAIEGIISLGPLAVPYLISEISSNIDNKERAALEVAAASVLQRMGENAVPPLIDGLKNKSAESWISYCLGLIPAAVPQLVETFQHGDHQLRSIVAESLGAQGGNAVIAVSALESAVAEVDVKTRIEIAFALSRIVPGHEEGMAILESALRSDSPEIRERALFCLSIVGNASNKVIALIKSAEKDEFKSVRLAACDALRRLEAT